jgi:hypothetical protein
LGPIEPVLARLEPLVLAPIRLRRHEFNDLVSFVRFGLLDRKALPHELCKLLPETVPSGRPLPFFEGCKQSAVTVCRIPRGRPDLARTVEVSHRFVYAILRLGGHVGACR